MLSLSSLSTSYTMNAAPRAAAPRAATAAMAATSDEYTIAVLGDLHLDPRDLDHSHP